MLMAFDHRQKIPAARTLIRTPSKGLERANQNETFQPESWAFMLVQSNRYVTVALCWRGLWGFPRKSRISPRSIVSTHLGRKSGCT